MSNKKNNQQDYKQLDDLLDYAYGPRARQNATRERNAVISKALKKKTEAVPALNTSAKTA